MFFIHSFINIQIVAFWVCLYLAIRGKLRFEIEANQMDLYNGHKSFYGKIRFGKTTYWIQRWDIARTSGHKFISEDGLMGWTWGKRS